MISRLLLSLLLLLSAPMTIAQHAGCAVGGAVDTVADPGEQPVQAHHDGHRHPSGAVLAIDDGVGGHNGDCGSCGLACQLACAAAALPSASFDLAGLPLSTAPTTAAGAGLLHPHRLPLLRPPSHAFA